MQEILDVHQRLQRGEEELIFIKSEICNVCYFLQDEQKIIHNVMCTENPNSGELALLVRKLVDIEGSYLRIKSYFPDYDLPEIQVKFAHAIQIDPDEETLHLDEFEGQPIEEELGHILQYQSDSDSDLCDDVPISEEDMETSSWL